MRKLKTKSKSTEFNKTNSNQRVAVILSVNRLKAAGYSIRNVVNSSKI